MEKFVLSTDSCCDELKSTLKKNKIEYIPMCYICNEEVFYDNFDSLEDYKFFYDEMKRGKMFSTTGLNHFEVKEYFERILKEHDKDIVHITLSSGLSVTNSVVKQVAEEINQNSKNKIYVLDSLSATQGQNALLNYGQKLRYEGKDAKTTLEILEGASKKLCVYFFLSDLETLKRGGRISGAQAVMAKMMQLRPILRFNSKGELEVVEKVIGVKKAIRRLFDIYMRERDPNNTMPIYLTFSGDNNNVHELLSLIEERTGLTNTICNPIGPVICSHTGPSVTGIIFIGKNPHS
jgi:DegV family protein with EDD domain